MIKLKGIPSSIVKSYKSYIHKSINKQIYVYDYKYYLSKLPTLPMKGEIAVYIRAKARFLVCFIVDVFVPFCRSRGRPRR